MASKKKAPVYTYLETWNTRFGQQERVVMRREGKFVDSVNLNTLRKGKPVAAK